MHSVGIIIPIIGYTKNQQKIIEKYAELQPEIEKLGFNNIDLMTPGEDYQFVRAYGPKVRKRTAYDGGYPPKGDVIQESIKSLSSEVNYIVVCDGSLKIPLESIIDVLRAFKSDNELHAVIGTRKNSKAISPARYLIERFEIFLIAERYGASIEDGQCGCWGFKVFRDVDRKINLSAVGYAIELDFLIEVLHKKLNLAPIDVTIAPCTETVGTHFSFDQNIDKMQFLVDELGLTSVAVEAGLEKFEGKNTDLLSECLNSDEDKKYYSDYKSELFKTIKFPA